MPDEGGYCEICGQLVCEIEESFEEWEEQNG